MVNRAILIAVACAALCAAQSHKVSVIAHRGEHLSHPENTLAAFQAAIDLRADYIELDVRTTRDGKLVLMHDNRVDRTTNGKGEVEKMSFDEIRSLEVKGGGKVPTFDEALSLAKGRIGVYVDAKQVAPTDLVDALERHDMIEHSVIYGNWTFLKQVLALNGKARVMPEAGSPAHLRQVLSERHPPVVAFDTRDFTSETIALARNAKALVFVDCLGPADTPASWENAIRRGADGIQTDHPGKLVAFLRKAPFIGAHRARYDSHGILRAWSSWTDIVKREMNWYLRCPIEHGYPRFVYMTFMDGNYQAVQGRRDTIPSMQDGMGIISYLKYYNWKNKSVPKVLEFARYLGDYLVKESLTPDTGKYPRFTRSTGLRGRFPQPPDCGSQGDRPYEIEPDKGGIAGYALVLLYEETKDRKYLDQALQNARVLVANMGTGDEHKSPRPFRADFRSGAPRGPVSSDMSFILRLFDALIEHGYSEFVPPRERLWAWIRDYQLPDLKRGAKLWVQFFEDYDRENNRNSWAPLNLARYLVEKQAALDPAWRRDAYDLIEFVVGRFTSIRYGVPVCGEQDGDLAPWGGALSTYGAVLALYSKATGSDEFRGLAYQALTIALYATGPDGCPRDSILHTVRGGWQEDAHTDKIHNFIDALTAFPEWGK